MRDTTIATQNTSDDVQAFDTSGISSPSAKIRDTPATVNSIKDLNNDVNLDRQVNEAKRHFTLNSVGSVYGKDNLESLIKLSELTYVDDIDLSRLESDALQLRKEPTTDSKTVY